MVSRTSKPATTNKPAAATSAAQVLAALADPFTGEALFDALGDVVFFIKNAKGEYVVVNQTLVTRCGLTRKSDLIGKTPEEVFPTPLGRSFRVQDRQLLRTGGSLINQLERHLYPNGESGWCLTTKVALLGANGAVMGLAGISRDLYAERRDSTDYERVATVVEYLRSHLDEPLTVEELADKAGMSIYRLDQRIRRIYHVSTGQLIRKSRIDAALDQLRTTNDSLGAIAHASGYCDQSAFTRQFRQMLGLTPGEYRRSLRGSN